ncbi:MAG: chemotaxis protein CheX [Lentisphaeraceae bacterium]|nr:chemotaxis protein CheX [Lentisphaeraceae bacterium]
MEKEVLTKMLETLSENLELMFQKKTTPTTEFNECNRPDFNDEYMGMISLANQSNQGQMIISMSKTAVEDMLAEVMQLVSTPEEAHEMVKASLGELLNTVSGAFAQNEEVLAKYECLDLSTPMIWEKDDSPYFCRTEGMSGHLIYENDKTNVNVFLAINPYKVFDATPAATDDSSSDFLGDDLDDLLSGL